MEDVVVIGAGVVGTAAAFNLAKSGFRMTLVDTAPPGMGCSFGNAGLIAVDHVAPLASPDTLSGVPRMLLRSDSPLRLHPCSVPRMTPWMVEFLRQSRQRNFERNTAALASIITRAAAAWHRLLDQHIARDLFRDIGSLYVFEKPVARNAEHRALSLLDHYGVQYRNLTAHEVRREFLPTLTPHISHARYFPGMASVANPHHVVQGLFDAALNAGARFRLASVDGIKPSSGGKIELLINGERTLADKVLIAAGARSRQFLEALGSNVPLTPERGYHVELSQPKTDLLKVPVSFMERGFTCNPMADGIRLAGTVELGAGSEPDWKRADILAAHFRELFPEGAIPEVASRWHGDRPTLPDYLPMIGELPLARNVFVATGHQHLGLTLGPLTGELVSQLMARATPEVDLLPFRVDRFLRGKDRSHRRI